MNWKGTTTLSALILAFGIMSTGCADHVHRVYDPYYSDYHEWGPGETVYYNQWYTETYHDRNHRDYKHLNKEEQHKYWDWRHQHGDHDHDRDRDRDHDKH